VGRVFARTACALDVPKQYRADRGSIAAIAAHCREKTHPRARAAVASSVMGERASTSDKATAATIAFARMGSVVVLVHGSTTPSDGEWRAYLSFLEEIVVDAPGVLVFTEGAAPSAPQRTAVSRLVAQRGGRWRTSVVTQDTVARGIVTLMSWFNPDIRAFSPGAMAEALDYLGVREADREPLRRRVLALRAQVAGALSGVAGEIAGSTSAAVDALLAAPLASLRQEIAKRSVRPPPR